MKDIKHADNLSINIKPQTSIIIDQKTTAHILKCPRRRTSSGCIHCIINAGPAAIVLRVLLTTQLPALIRPPLLYV